MNEVHPSRLLVDLTALRANYRWLAQTAVGAEAGAVVKGDGYGLGLARIARALAQEGARTFFVATLAEAVQLRSVLPQVGILVLGGAWRGDVGRFRHHRLVPVLNSVAQVRDWLDLAGGADWWLHVDTGMSRLGVDDQALATLGAAASLSGLVGVMTHLACADRPADPVNAEQLRRFDAVRAHFPGRRTSIANSAGILLGGPWLGDLARPGIALYGIQPQQGGGAPLRPVGRFQARVQQLRSVDRPLRVGYGGTHAQRDGVLLTLAAGYADGYPRALGNRGWVGCRGRHLPVVGRVSMDSLVVDASALAAAGELPAVGEWVDLWGGDVDAEALAACIDTIAYELLVQVGSRVPRIALV